MLYLALISQKCFSKLLMNTTVKYLDIHKHLNKPLYQKYYNVTTVEFKEPNNTSTLLLVIKQEYENDH